MRSLYKLFIILILFFIHSSCSEIEKSYTNSVGIKFVRIENGTFTMGESKTFNSQKLGGIAYLNNGDYDEHPVHNVEISESFYISVEEITIEQFKKFRPNYAGVEKYSPYATGISWYDANAYCEWLSKKENKNYRLPTEAEWEYSARAGSSTLFFSGDSLPDSSNYNNWGLKNVSNNIAEWVYDWYGPYGSEDQVDPIGRDNGFTKVIRGAGLDRLLPFYSRSANRSSMPPNFPPIPLEDLHKENRKQIKNTDLINNEEKLNKVESVEHYQSFYKSESNNQGYHNVGFRIVEGKLPSTNALPQHIPFVNQAIIQNKEVAKISPNKNIPYFKRRNLLPIPPDNIFGDKLKSIDIVGLDPGILGHNHSPALEVAANGDIILIIYTSVEEIDPDVALIESRLRFGSNSWDMPEIFLDCADVDDHAPLLWNDNDTLKFYWGHNKLDPGFPFQWISSTDNGANWGRINFPIFQTLIGDHSAQPINSAFRDSKGNIYVASDAIGGQSVLWLSKNNGKSWIDTGSRTGGRHTTFALLKNDKILGMGGKSTNINGYMPKSISTDFSYSWKVSKTPLPSLGSNQRPTIIKLQSGRLFFAGDYQRKDGYQPSTIKERGSYVALSEDDGLTWKIKKLPGTLPHEDKDRALSLNGNTIGYSVARQAPNGIIHLITTMNTPCLHFALNEAWILNDDTDTSLTVYSNETNITELKKYSEKYSNGKIKSSWIAGMSNTGRYLLHGTKKTYYQNGQEQWEVDYNLGEKVGEEIYYSPEGNLIWKWNHKDDGTSIWTNYYSNGNKKTESIWRNKRAIGTATKWDENGDLLNQLEFKNGFME
ncbi:MAG: SUMF1/EgtB/PvdO family nonheme iron enzyme [Ignavibacteriales bacterium]|nr:SUMF1/EgtB/PvdO family nonheme iron enzyme [Ignavibacteriales bacterium]